ncbi:hypothetical protein GCK32_000220 [Trichostrongylus colubriformis]|uniref:Uncharacterized protein n=1 Tax=Trichostrongylus colubriformis TaxID=6319 RepID=A0AAN8EW70_TRICO
MRFSSHVTSSEVADSWVMRIDGMRAAGIARFSQSSCYVTFDCRPRAIVLHLLLFLLLLPAANSLTYFVGTSVKQVGSADVTQDQPFLSKDDKQTIVMFCRAALSNALTPDKIKDPLELRRICGTLIREFKRQRETEGEMRASF